MRVSKLFSIKTFLCILLKTSTQCGFAIKCFISCLQFLTGRKAAFYRCISDGELIGSIAAFACSSLPSGWLLCDGSAISRTTYSALFSSVGTTYGTGDGSTTFNVPNLVDRFIEGATTSGTVKAAGLPNITGQIGFRAFMADNLMTINSLTPKAFAFTQGNGATFGWKIDRVTNSDNQKCDTLYFDANKSNSIYSDSVNTVQPPALTMRYAIYTGNVGKYSWLRTA